MKNINKANATKAKDSTNKNLMHIVTNQEISER